MKVYVVTECCCNHFAGLFTTREEALESRGAANAEALEEQGYWIQEYEVNHEAHRQDR